MKKLRVGFGYDVHPFKKGRKLILGGVEIPHAKGLDGHSDADVILHAAMDALLGAAALGDIGEHFPPSDPKYKNISSLKLLAHVARLLKRRKARVQNLDLMLLAEAPKVKPFRDRMTANIARALGLSRSDVQVKATTNERMGFVGREEGMAACAVCLIQV